MSRLAFAAAVLVSMVAGKLLRAKSDHCGKGFDALNPGSQKYFVSAGEKLWTHPGRKANFGIFETELKCWYSNMLTTKCGGLESQAAARKKQLTEVCADVGANFMPVWNKFTPAEVEWFKKTFPNDADDHYATADHRETASTMLTLNKKEVLCMTLFVIDDNCVDSMYIRTA
eukprot:TRINITY_DN41540_c0_g1_i1.p1 TRINITY_DN41540_c0_g1~~TRINITY_DN41540_c0_g1_i1.p1  ORF type:complete len:202 (+),score=44.46 TRINITY_DN41540_c0_g1_i1:91-606(+)